MNNVEIYIFLFTFESTSKEFLIFVICITNKGNKKYKLNMDVPFWTIVAEDYVISSVVVFVIFVLFVCVVFSMCSRFEYSVEGS